MATVKICDRCGTAFEPFNKWIKVKPVRSLLYVMTKRRVSVEGDVANCVYRSYDLCHDCLADLDKFMRGQATDGIEEDYLC